MYIGLQLKYDLQVMERTYNHHRIRIQRENLWKVHRNNIARWLNKINVTPTWIQRISCMLDMPGAQIYPHVRILAVIRTLWPIRNRWVIHNILVINLSWHTISSIHRIFSRYFLSPYIYNLYINAIAKYWIFNVNKFIYSSMNI